MWRCHHSRDTALLAVYAFLWLWGQARGYHVRRWRGCFSGVVIEAALAEPGPGLVHATQPPAPLHPPIALAVVQLPMLRPAKLTYKKSTVGAGQMHKWRGRGTKKVSH